MHGPDGTDYENTTKYLEVVPLKKLVYDHGGHEDRPPLFRVTVLFTGLSGDKTKMEMTSTLPSPEAAAEIRKLIKKASGESTWDRLAEYLAKTGSGTEKFVIARAFDAPIETLFDLWTDPKHLTQWLPPAGFSMEFIECDLREGGECFFKMSNETAVLYAIFSYVAIDRPRKLIYEQRFSDEKKNVSRHPMLPVWPESIRTTVEFAQEDVDRTRVTVTCIPSDSATAEEIEAFNKTKPSMTQGWNGSFDKLEASLPQVSLV